MKLEMATKKQKRIGIIVLIVVGVVLLGQIEFESPFATSLIVTSVDFFDRISNVNDLNDAFFIISASVGRGADEVVGSVSDAQFNQKLKDSGNDAWQTDFDLTFTADVIKEEAKYPISPQSGSAGQFKVFSAQRHIDPGIFGTPPSCFLGTSGNAIVDIDIVGGDRFCVVENLVGKFGDLNEPTIQTDIGFEMKRTGSNITGTLSNIGTDSGLKELRDNSGKLVGRVRLTQVSESAGANPPDEDNFKTLFMSEVFFESNKGWRLLKDFDVDEYRILKTNAEQIDVGLISDLKEECDRFTTTEQANQCVKDRLDEILSDVVAKQQLLQQTSVILTGGSSFFENKLSESSGKIRYVPFEKQLTNPEILLEVQAAWIGVRTLVSEPEITKLECPTFTQNGEIKVDVKNKGQISSRFGVKLDSCGSFDQISEPITKTIGSQSTSSFIIPIDSKGLRKIETCTVTAFNTELPQTLKSTDTIQCESKEITVCVDGEHQLTKQEGKDCVKICQGGEFQTPPAFCCDEKGAESFINPDNAFVNYRCKGNETSELRTCQSCDEFAVSKLFNLFGDTDIEFIKERQCEPKILQTNTLCAGSLLKFAVVPLVLILATLFGFNFFQNSKQLKIKNKGLAFLVSLIIGGVLAFIIFSTFLIGVIVAIGYLIITLVLRAGGVKQIQKKVIG